MFSLIKQLFTVLLSFSEPLAHDWTKCMILNDEPCMVRPTIINLDPVKTEYYPCLVSKNICNKRSKTHKC